MWKPRRLRELERGGIEIETWLTDRSGVGARTLIQLDGDVLLAIDRKFETDLRAQHAHAAAVRDALASLRRLRAWIRAIIPAVGGASATALAVVHHQWIAAVPALLAAWSVLQQARKPIRKHAHQRLAASTAAGRTPAAAGP